MQERWPALRYPVDLVVLQHLDHFNVVDRLRSPDCELVQLQSDIVMRRC